MKKYLLGFAALIIVISVSAFASKKLISKSATVEQQLFWYPVKPNSAEIDHTLIINPTQKLTKTEMRNNDLIPCEEGTGADCIRGFTTIQTSDNDYVSVDATQKVE